MSFNPVLARARPEDKVLFPLPSEGEVLVLQRSGIQLQMLCGDIKYAGKGRIYLSSKRIVFIKDGPAETQKTFASLEIPLAKCYGEERNQMPSFHQPIFGANYLKGQVLPTANAEYPIPMNGRWSLTFKEGGCQVFLTAFHNLYRAARRESDARIDSHYNSIINSALGGRDAAFLDPTDPSIIYTAQPVPAQQLQYVGNQYQPFVPQQRAPVVAPPPYVQTHVPPPPVGAVPVYAPGPPPPPGLVPYAPAYMTQGPTGVPTPVYVPMVQTPGAYPQPQWGTQPPQNPQFPPGSMPYQHH